MTEPRLGYYVHHQGAGHFARALAIVRALDRPVTLFGSAPPPMPLPAPVEAIALPPDWTPGITAEPLPALHYAPLAMDGLRQRMGLLADWFRHAWPCLLVVDVSVEVALLARLFGVPTCYVRQHGRRDDLPHRQAYAAASALLAPYPPEMESPSTPADMLAKTRHCGWISRFAGRRRVPREAGRVLVINGRGGTAFDRSALATAARACPGHRWRVVGELPGTAADMPANLSVLGILDDPFEELCRASVVIGSAGDSLVSEAASLGCRYIAVAEPRPFDEQLHQALRLQALGVALGLDGWPPAGRWPGLLAKAEALDPERWRAWAPADAPARAAAIIRSSLEECFRTPSAPR